jgi:hypothetical protein
LISAYLFLGGGIFWSAPLVDALLLVDNKSEMEPGGFEGEWNLGGLALEHRNKGENDKVEKCEGGACQSSSLGNLT